MITSLANHLWQSTVFAAAAGLLTLALRRNRARIRYWVWLAVSVKFLLPFSILVDAGSHLGWHTVRAMAQSGLTAAIEQVSDPFAPQVPFVAVPAAAQPSAAGWIPAILYAIWTIGFVTLVSRWWLRWRALREAVRTASQVDLPIEMEVRTSPGFAEPGVFGVLRPVLLLPEGIASHLSPPQLEAILGHELCHARRRDNLATAIHMAVEAVFWFHPLVWWLGARLMEERERGCDEEVLRLGSEPRVYAEGILRVCELYLESPLPCMAGVTGGNLRERIETIMSNRAAVELTIAKKALLGIAGMAAVLAPIVAGIANAPAVRAESPQGGARFEVASVKPGDRRADTGGMKGEGPGARDPELQVEHKRFTATNFNLFGLILRAYGIRGCRALGDGNCALLSGGPDWLKKDGFDIAAKMPEDSPEYTLAQFRNGHAPQLQLMLQALLAERFQLQVHHETKQIPVLALSIAGKGPKLKKAAEGEDPLLIFLPSSLPNGESVIQLVAKNSSMQELADLLWTFMDRPVLDRTGLPGGFDFTLEYEANADAAGPFTAATGPGLFRALQAQAGLKLEATTGSVEVLVIDHVERPTEND